MYYHSYVVTNGREFGYDNDLPVDTGLWPDILLAYNVFALIHDFTRIRIYVNEFVDLPHLHFV